MARDLLALSGESGIRKTGTLETQANATISLGPLRAMLSKNRIFDCFLFFNELDLLKIRLEELQGIVDRFVLVEASRTFSGARKPLYFHRYRDFFSEYPARITQHVVSDMPGFAGMSRWRREHHQRDAIGVALARAGCKPSDVVLVSDVDEIPCGERIADAVGLLESHDLVIFEQVFHQYYVNNIREESWLGTVACRYDFLRTLGSVQRLRFGEEKCRRAGIVSSKTNLERKYPHIANGGWHLSWLGGPDAVLYKQQSYSHCERDPTANRRLPYIRFNIGLSKLVEDHGRSTRSGFTPRRNFAVDCELPRYLSGNRELFAHFFEPAGDREEEDNSTVWYGANYNSRRYFYARVELVINRMGKMLWHCLPRLTAALKRAILLR